MLNIFVISYNKDIGKHFNNFLASFNVILRPIREEFYSGPNYYKYCSSGF